MMSEVTAHAILLVNEYGTTVFGVSRFVVTQYCWFFFTVRNDGDLVSRNAFTLEVHFNSVCTTFTQGDVVLRSTTSPWVNVVQTLLKCTSRVKAFLLTRSPSFLTVKKNQQYWVTTKRLTPKTVVPYSFTKRIA